MSGEDGSEPGGLVYQAYGGVMHTVQYWELMLALCWWSIQTPASDAREAESKAAAKAVARLEKAFTKVTPGQARNDLEGEMPDELLAQVGELIDDRNRLAHRFLREQQAGTGFRPGTLDWLGDAGARFEASVAALAEDEMSRSGPYEGGVRPHWPALGAIVGKRLFGGEPVDFQDALRQAREEPEGT